jgi:hypothetical protein
VRTILNVPLLNELSSSVEGLHLIEGHDEFHVWLALVVAVIIFRFLFVLLDAKLSLVFVKKELNRGDILAKDFSLTR